MMKRMFAIFVFVVLFSGCANHLYYFQSAGEFVYNDAQTKSALIYWHGHKGRQLFWRFDDMDSSANLRICQSASAYTFEPAEDGTLVMRADNGDRLLATQSPQGEIAPLETLKRAQPGKDVCGGLFVDGKPAKMNDLDGAHGVVVTVLCDSPMSPGRYPKADAYSFAKVTKKEVEKQQNPSPCEAAQ